MNPYILSVLLFFSFKPTVDHSPFSYRPLSWSDFKAAPSRKADIGVVAETYTRLEFITLGKPGGYVFGVAPLFFPDSSWTTTTEEAVLSHENVHFAITMIVAKWAQAGIKPLQHTGLRKEAIEGFNKYVDLWEQMEKDFDSETQNGLNTAQEIIWERNIYKKLSELLSEEIEAKRE